jgi:hypothetical protein
MLLNPHSLKKKSLFCESRLVGFGFCFDTLQGFETLEGIEEENTSLKTPPLKKKSLFCESRLGNSNLIFWSNL